MSSAPALALSILSHTEVGHDVVHLAATGGITPLIMASRMGYGEGIHIIFRSIYKVVESHVIVWTVVLRIQPLHYISYYLCHCILFCSVYLPSLPSSDALLIPSVVSRLLSLGAVVDACNTWEESALLWACVGGWTDVARALVKEGANVNQKSVKVYRE